MKLTYQFTWRGSAGGNCPAVYITDQGDAVIQGYALHPADAAQMRNLAADEAGVRIPYELCEQIAAMVNERRSTT